MKIGDGLDEQIAEYEKGKGSGDDARTTEYEIEAPKHAYANAGHFLAAKHVEDGVTLLRYHQGVFHRWRKEAGYYVALDDKALRDEVYQFFDHKAYAGTRGDTLIFGADSTNVNKVIDALASRTLIAKDTEPPAWLDQAEHPPASELVVTENGILHVLKRVLLRYTPQLFATHRLAFAYNPKAPKPHEWLAFLESLKIGKKGIDFLHEILGYILSGDTSLHKIFLIVGPPRSGKGTIGRVLGALIGTHNVTSPTLAQLSETFGLEDLIGKPLAIVADARLAGRSDKTVIIERLLSISGEDHQTINRKYMKAWNGKLAVRFLDPHQRDPVALRNVGRVRRAHGANPAHGELLRTRRHGAYRAALRRAAGDLQSGACRLSAAPRAEELRASHIILETFRRDQRTHEPAARLRRGRGLPDRARARSAVRRAAPPLSGVACETRRKV